MSRAQHGHCFVLVAVLRAIVLALHDDIGRQVGDSNRRFGLVDMLAAGARRTKDIDAQVGRIDVDLDRVVDFRIGVERGKRGLAQVAGAEGRFAHQPVNAGLGA